VMSRLAAMPSPRRARLALLLTTLTGLASVLAALPASAAGDVEAGRTKSVICAACHGVDGNSLNPEWPSMAGQHDTYLTAQLHAFKKGARQNVIMAGQVTALSEQDIEDIAAFFSAQKRQPKTADPRLVRAGERLYRGGDKENGTAACLACHGPAGHGNQPAGFPAIAGQHAVYTTNQLKAYRAGARATDPNQIMRNVAERLTDAEIEALASYIQGLR
jgi:cytochrome c553